MFKIRLFGRKIKSINTSVFIFILGLLVLFFLKNILFIPSDYIMQGGDLVQTYYQKCLYQVSILNHELPLWNPYLYCGYPYLAHPYNGTFYPLNLFFLLMPVHTAYSWIFALHVFLSGLFMFLLVKFLTKSDFSGFISGITFMLSGYMTSRLWAGHYEVYATSVWIPLVFLLFYKAIKRKSFIFAVSSGVVLAIQFLAGHTQTFYFTVMILGLYALFECKLNILFCLKYLNLTLKRKQYLEKPKRLKGAIWGVLIRAAILVSALIVCIWLAAIQALPTFEMIKYSTRGPGNPFFMSAYGSFPPEHIVRFFLPDFFGNFLKTLYAGDPLLGEIHWEINYYIGLLPMFMAMYVLSKKLNEKTKKILFLSFSFIIILSSITRIVFLQLWNIRNSSAIPNPFAQSLVSFFERVYTSGISLNRVAPAIFLFFLIIFFLLLMIKRKMIDPVKSTYRNDQMVLFFALLSLVGFVLALGQYAPGGLYFFLYKFVPGYNKFKWPARHLIICNFGLCVLAGYAVARLKKSFRLKHMIVFLILVDLFFYGSKYFYAMELSEFYPNNKVQKFLKQNKDRWRLLPLAVLKPKAVYEPSCVEFQANACVPLTQFNVVGYDPMILKRYHEFTNFMQGVDLNDFGNTTIRVKDFGNKNLIKLLNIKYVFAKPDLKSYDLNIKGTKEIENYKTSSMFEITDTLPRFNFVQNVFISKSDDEIINRLKNKDFNPKYEVVLEKKQMPPEVEKVESISVKSLIEVVKYEENEIVLKVKTANSGYLVASDVFYPGWKASLDGKQAKIYRANYTFRAIYVPNFGEHTISFYFKPESFKKGRCLSLLGLFFIACYYIIIAYKKSKKLRQI